MMDINAYVLLHSVLLLQEEQEEVLKDKNVL